MERTVPRVVLAGTGSGCGKTTVTCAVLQALTCRGMKVAAFKCGPDYIDPMFHSRIIGAASSNLDTYFFDRNTLNSLLAENSAGCGVSIIEGVMGFYDGLSLTTGRASTYETAALTASPVVLVVDAKGASLSVLAVIKGFMDFMPDNGIKGVILNRCTSGTYGVLKQAILDWFGGKIQPLGYMPSVPESALESRHLGLVTAAEVEDLKKKMLLLAEKAEETVDLDGLLRLAESAPAVEYEEPVFRHFDEPVRIAVARDKAFCFYYEDSLRVLEKMGAELVSFSPLDDLALPDDIDGLYLGGGYPELYTDRLSGNKTMLESVRKALEAGLPCIAECGGFMYLTGAIDGRGMVGYLPSECYDNGRLTRFGYVMLEAKADNMLCRRGERIPGHEFHHWDSGSNGESFKALKESGRSWDCVHATDRLYAGFPHFHFRANPSFAENFYETCLKEKRERDTEH